MYGQQAFNPYMQAMNYNQNQSLQRVNGIEGAKSYQLGANSTVALFDSNSDIFYVKSTDSSGFPNIRIFKFEEVSQNTNSINENYITRQEMEEYVKQFIQQPSKSTKQNITTNGISEKLGKSRGFSPTDVSE